MWQSQDPAMGHPWNMKLVACKQSFSPFTPTDLPLKPTHALFSDPRLECGWPQDGTEKMMPNVYSVKTNKNKLQNNVYMTLCFSIFCRLLVAENIIQLLLQVPSGDDI